MLPIKFRLNPTYGLGGDVIWRFWISEGNDFSNSESLCHCDASHQVSAQSDLRFRRICCLRNFKMAAMVAILDIRTILAILDLCAAPMPSIKFKLNLTYGLGGDVIWRISRWRPSCISERNDFSNSESLCRSDTSYQVLAQSDLWSGRCRLKNFKMARQPSWISEQNDFSNSEPLCHSDASHQVSAQSDLQFGRRCRLKNFKMAAITAILDIRMEWFYQFWISMLPQCLLLSFSSNQLMILKEMSKMWKANDGRTTDRQRTTGHDISWPGAKNTQSQKIEDSVWLSLFICNTVVCNKTDMSE